MEKRRETQGQGSACTSIPSFERVGLKVGKNSCRKSTEGPGRRHSSPGAAIIYLRRARDPSAGSWYRSSKKCALLYVTTPAAGAARRRDAVDASQQPGGQLAALPPVWAWAPPVSAVGRQLGCPTVDLTIPQVSMRSLHLPISSQSVAS